MVSGFTEMEGFAPSLEGCACLKMAFMFLEKHGLASAVL